MVRRKEIEEKEVEVPLEQEKDVIKLTKALVREFNKEEAKTGKIAWNLATDLDNPTDVREYIDTGSTLLNYVISNKRDGGIPVGKLTEISGEEASGKSLLCAHLAASVQKRGGIVVYIDTENAMSPDFMTQLGVDLNKLVYLQPGTVEEVAEAIVKSILMTRQKAPDKLVLIIWDSIAGTPCQVEIEGTADLNMNEQLEKSKVLSKMMRQITQVLGKERIALVFTNQLKVKIGVMYGDPMTTPGGKAVPYHASVRVRLTRGSTEKEGDDAKGDVTGVNTSAKIVKNRLGPPLRKAKFFISFANGIEDIGSWFECLHEKGVITKANGWCLIPEFESFVQLTVQKEIERLGTLNDEESKKKLSFTKKCMKEFEGWKFRESTWTSIVDGTPYLKDWILEKFEDLLVIRYGQKSTEKIEADPESLMEAEQLTHDIMTGGE